MTQWEYMILESETGEGGYYYGLSEEELDKHGKDGWEAVSVRWSTVEPGKMLAVLLKRPKTP